MPACTLNTLASAPDLAIARALVRLQALQALTGADPTAQALLHEVFLQASCMASRRRIRPVSGRADQLH